MARNSNLLSKRRSSRFTIKANPDNYQSLSEMIRPTAYADFERKGLVGGIATITTAEIPYQSTIFVGKSTDSYLSYYIFDYTNNTVSDTIKLPYRYYSNDYVNIYPINNSGYAIQRYDNDLNENTYIFIDQNGNIVDAIENVPNGDGAWYDSLDGIWVMYINNTSGTSKFYNGNVVLTKEINPANEYIDIFWDWDATSADGSIFIELTNTNTNTTTITKIDAQGNESIIVTYDNSLYSYQISQKNCDNFAVFAKLTQADNFVIELSIYSHNTNTFIQTEILSAIEYNNYNNTFYSKNKFIAILYNDNTAIDWKIIQYDGNTNVLLSTTHERGTNYIDYRWYATDLFNLGPFDCPIANSDNAALLFYSYDSNYVGFYDVYYADFLLFIDGAESISTYTFANDEGTQYKYIDFNNSSAIANSIYIPVINGDSNFSILTLNGTTNPITVIGSLADYSGNLSQYAINTLFGFGERMLINLNNDDTGDLDIFIFTKDGAIQDSQLNQIDYNDYQNTNLVYFNDDNSQGWYINDSVTSITSTGYYNDIYYPQPYITNDGYEPRVLLLRNADSNAYRIITDKSITSQFSLPQWNVYYDIVVGKDHFIYLYDNNDSQYIIEVYDFSGNLLNSKITEFYSQQTSYNLCFFNDRGFLRGFVDGIAYTYLISPENITLGQQIYRNTSPNPEYTVNDYNSWIYIND